MGNCLLFIYLLNINLSQPTSDWNEIILFSYLGVYVCAIHKSSIFLKTTGLVRIFHLIRILRFSAVLFAKWINPLVMVYQ